LFQGKSAVVFISLKFADDLVGCHHTRLEGFSFLDPGPKLLDGVGIVRGYGVIGLGGLDLIVVILGFFRFRCRLVDFGERPITV
jgi:hypothetical protein